MEQSSAPARPLWDRIQTACAERGWNMSRLERETGVTRQTIAKWKTQPRPPQAGTVSTVAQVLGIDLQEALQLAGILPAATPVAVKGESEGDQYVSPVERGLVDALLDEIERDPRKRARLRRILAGRGHEPNPDSSDGDNPAGREVS